MNKRDIKEFKKNLGKGTTVGFHFYEDNDGKLHGHYLIGEEIEYDSDLIRILCAKYVNADEISERCLAFIKGVFKNETIEKIFLFSDHVQNSDLDFEYLLNVKCDAEIFRDNLWGKEIEGVIFE